MKRPYASTGWLLVAAGLICGVALGAFWPDGTPSSSIQGAKRAQDSESGVRAEGSEQGATPSSGTVRRDGLVFGGAGEEEERIKRLSPDRLISLFERVSKLKSDSRKYILAYRLASFLGPEQIQQALKAAKEDLEDGDYVAMRALARRWAELDPQAAIKTGLETKQSHLFYPALESWSHMEPGAPMRWAMNADPDARLKTLQALLGSRLLDQSQLEELVARSSNSDNQDLRQQILPSATMRLAESAPGNALFSAGSIDDPQLRERTVRLVLTRISRSAPDVGQAWINAQKTLTPELREQYQAILSRTVPKAPR